MNEKYEPSLALRAVLVACALAVVSQLYWPLPVLPQLARDLGATATAAAGAVSAFGLAYAVGFLVFGPLSDRLGRRAVMAWGLAALALATVALAGARSAAVLLPVRALQGLAAAAFAPAVIAYLSERGTQRQRTWSVAWVSTAFLCAGLLGQIYGVAVAGRWGVGAAMLPLAAFYACTAWMLGRTPADAALARPSGAARPRAPAEAWRAVRPLLADARLRRAYGPALPLLLCFVAFYLLLDAHAAQALAARGMTPLAVRALALPAFMAPLAVAAAMPRWGASRLAVLGLSTAAAALALAGWAGAGHVLELLAASVLLALGVGISVPSLITCVAGAAGAAVRGLAVSLYTFVLFVGASLGPWLAQHIAHWPLAQSLALLAALLGAAAAYAASAGLANRLFTTGDRA